MAVPKKKRSISKIKLRYVNIYKKPFINRKFSYNMLDLIKVCIKKENWISNVALFNKYWKYKIKSK